LHIYRSDNKKTDRITYIYIYIFGPEVKNNKKERGSKEKICMLIWLDCSMNSPNKKN
jgi:hypothetical protein